MNPRNLAFGLDATNKGRLSQEAREARWSWRRTLAFVVSVCVLLWIGIAGKGWLW